MKRINIRELALIILLSVICQSCNQKKIGTENNSRLEAEIRNVMLEFIEASSAPGMGLGYYSDKIGTVMVAVGKSDLENNIPLKTSTHYPIQSTSKMFISILTLQLIEEGKLTLESTIDEWIDFIPNSSQITIRHLLKHTSGLKDYQYNSDFIDEYYSEIGKEYTRDDIIHAGLKVSSDGEIGDKEYANTNYLLLANIIETITDRSIGQVLEQRIFRSAEMDNTYFKPEIINDSNNIVKCYRFGESVDLDKINYLSNAAGGIVSTIEDMQKFAHWIMDNNYHILMAPESELIDLFASFGLSSKYGLGIEVVDSLFSIKMMGHSGGNPGLIHDFYFSTETGEIIVYYLNEGRVGKPFAKFREDLDTILQQYR